MLLKYSKVISVFLMLVIALFSSAQKNYSQENTNYKKFEPFTMAVVSDIHLSFNPKDNWILTKESLVIAQDVIKALNKTKKLDFIIIGGDLIDNADKELMDLPVIQDVLAELIPPYYVIMGDRDADFSKYYSKYDFLTDFNRDILVQREKTYWFTEPVPGVLLVGLDTTVKNQFKGQISPEQLIWLDKTLHANSNKFIIITMHHPAFPLGNQEEKYFWGNFVLKNSNDFLKLINNHPQVKLILNGHRHASLTKKINDKIFVSVSSIVTYPNQYSLITVYPNKVTIENKQINYKQIINKAKKTLTNIEYAGKYNQLGSQKLIKLHKGKRYTKIPID